MKNAIDTLNNFTLEEIPDLDLVVLAALDLFTFKDLPTVPFGRFARPLVVGSGNAAQTGKILFNDQVAIFADESNFLLTLENNKDIDGVVVISASGSKHAVVIAKAVKDYGLPIILITNNPNPPAADYIDSGNIFVFPKNREPYTYNTSTYLGMVLAKTKEPAEDIKNYIEESLTHKLLRDFNDFNSFVFILPTKYAHLCEMVRTKFDELFGPYAQGRVFTEEEIKHAKTVVTSGDELFIAIGVDNQNYGLAKNRLSISVPNNINYGFMIAVCYYIVGCIQKTKPPVFKNNIENYTKQASNIFGQEIKPIVE